MTRHAIAGADLRYLRRVCLDVLQRTPSPAELRSYVGAPARMVVDHMYRELEAMEVWLEEELYYFLLLDNFRPRTEAIKTVPERLLAGRLTVKDATREIILSTGFSLRNPGNDTFVTVVLEQCLGLTVQEKRNRRLLEAGKAMYDGEEVRFLHQRGSTQADLVRIVLDDPGFARHLLDRHHRRLFDAPLPAPEAAAAIQRLQEHPEEFFPILGDWLTSERYLDALDTKKLRTDRQFVRGLYMDLLDRRPTYEEMRNMRNALQSMADPTPLRAVMAKVILDSGKVHLPEFEKGAEEDFVRQCFLRYLGREPSQEELPAFVATLAEPGCEPTHVVRALVGSAEYQYY